jgi:phage terminase small subunit
LKAAATLRGNQRVSDRVEEILTKAAARVEITKSRVLEELGKIGFSNMLDYMRPGPDGDPTLDFSKLTRDVRGASETAAGAFWLVSAPSQQSTRVTNP